MRKARYENGFTLVELMVAMIVTSIVTTAVVTLAYALDTVNDVTDETSNKQAQIRFAALRVSDLIRHCKLICGTPGGELAVWRADDNGDGQININELVYINAGPGQDHIRLYECNNLANPVIALGDIASVGSGWWLGFYDSDTYAELIPACSNVQFLLDSPAPYTQLLSISFDLTENGIDRQYQISAGLRGWAGNLLDGSGNIISDDD